MDVERMNRIDEDIAKLDKMIRQVGSREDINEATQTEKFMRNGFKSGKLERIKEDNLKLKEEIYKLETQVSALNATSLSKENRLQNVLKTQKDLERTISRKVSELKHLLNETKKYKETAYNRIAVLEEKCEKLNKKVNVQDQELKSVKERYLNLKKKLSEKRKDEKNKIARSTSTTEMCDKEIQVDDILLINIDTTVEDLFFLPSQTLSPKKVKITF